MATRIIEFVDAAPGVSRRRFSDDDKARIVSEAMMPGATVAEVGRRHGVCGSLIYRWRRTLIGTGRALSSPTGFVPVEVAGPCAAVPEALGSGAVEVVLASGHRVRLAPPIDARVLKAVLAVLT